MGQKPLIFHLKSLDNQIKRLFEKSAIKNNDADLTGMQYAMLRYITFPPNRTILQKDIEKEFEIRRSTASMLLQSLEKEGYIERRVFTDDARIKEIIPLDKAKILAEESRKNIECIEKKVTNGITAKELDMFYKILQKLSNNATE